MKKRMRNSLCKSYFASGEMRMSPKKRSLILVDDEGDSICV
jgi:hypothetical protein